MAALHRIYKWNDVNAEKQIVAMPPDIEDELTSAALLLCIRVGHLRLGVSTRISAPLQPYVEHPPRRPWDPALWGLQV